MRWDPHVPIKKGVCLFERLPRLGFQLDLPSNAMFSTPRNSQKSDAPCSVSPLRKIGRFDVVRRAILRSARPARLMEKACWIAEQLHRSCVCPDEGTRVSRTGAISPGTSLKSLETRKAFQWARQVTASRYFTALAVKKAIKLLLTKYEIQIPRIPGQTTQQWIETQAPVILHLCKRSRKNVASSLRNVQFGMDMADTQPMEAASN